MSMRRSRISKTFRTITPATILLALVPPAARERVELHPSSTTEVGLLLHGLDDACRDRCGRHHGRY